MMGQLWVKSKENYLSIQTNGKKGGVPILLLPGYSEPKSDLTYWLTYLAKRLIQEGYYVIQADLSGSGNSYGELKDASLEKMEMDLLAIIDFIYSSTSKKMYIVGRGLSAALAFRVSDNEKINSCVGVNPFFIDAVSLEKEILGQEMFYLKDDSENDMVKSVIRYMGAEITNIECQKIEWKVLESITNYDWKNLYSKLGKHNIIVRLVDELNTVEKIEIEDYISKNQLQYFQQKSFSDNGEKISELVIMVDEIINSEQERKEYNAGSNRN